MNVFIIGGSGFLGSRVIQKLLEKESVQKIYCLVHRSGIAAEDSRIIKVEGSIEDLDRVQIEDGIDVCAVLSGVTDGAEITGRMTMKVNYEGTVSAVSYCKKNHIPRICLASSVNVRMKRKGAYARSKIMAEKAVEESGLQYLVFRPALIYGAGCGKGLKVVEDFITKYGVVPVFGSGEKLEQPIHVDECAAFIAHYMLGESWDRTVELYGKDAMAYNQMCRLIAEAGGRKARLLHVPVWMCISGLRVLEALHAKLPVSREQIYHIDTDLAGDMGGVYRETGIYGDSFANNLKKKACG